MNEQSTFCLRLPTELKRELEDLAKRDSRSLNAEVKMILQNYLENEKKKSHND